MGHDDAAKLLQKNLDEEKAADQKLSQLAEGGLNQEAADAAHGDDEEVEEDDEPMAVASGSKSGGKRQSSGR